MRVAPPLEQAWARMVRVTFRPWELRRWLAVAFMLFLATLGVSLARMSHGLSHFLPLHRLLRQPYPDEPLVGFLSRTGGYYIALGTGALAIGLVLYAIVTFFTCRGRFMVFYAAIHNDTGIRRAWNQHARAANQTWRFLLAITVLFWLFNVAAAAIGMLVVWPDIRAETLGDRAYWTTIVGICTIPIVWLLYLKALVITADFIIPMMIARSLGPWRAWWIWLADFLTHHMWAIVLFYLIRMVLGSVAGSLGLLTCCLTCSIAGWPYLQSLVLLPVLLFDRLYAAYFVEQFGPEWVMFPTHDDEPPRCPGCRYDLRGNPDAAACPECGYELSTRPAT